MLSDSTPVTTLATGDMAAAREFYEGVLGFTPVDDLPGGVTYRAGTGQFFVYESSYAGTNKATYLAFQVPAERFQAEVDALRAKGIEFQTFDYPDMDWTGGVATIGEQRAVWFADPDGNILNVETMD